MEVRDGSFGFDLDGIYDEVVVHERLRYMMTDGRSVTTVFHAEGEATRVRTTFDADADNPVDMQRQGWQAILNNFVRYAGVST